LPLLWKNETVLGILPGRGKKRIATKKRTIVLRRAFFSCSSLEVEGKEKQAKDRRIKALEEENSRLKEDLKKALGKLYEKV